MKGKASADGPEAALSWRELAVTRSLDTARTRAENRVQRFLDAASELMHDAGGKEFTVQEVVDRSGQSLRSFYMYFGGKHELLLALLEESVRTSAEHLREVVAAEADALQRVHTFVVEYFRMCRPVGVDGSTRGNSPRRKAGTTKKGASPSPVLVEFTERLLTEHPSEAARTYVPLVSLFEELLDDAVAAGAVRADLRRRTMAGTVLELVMFNLFAARIGGDIEGEGEDGTDPAEVLWDLILNGVRAG